MAGEGRKVNLSKIFLVTQWPLLSLDGGGTPHSQSILIRKQINEIKTWRKDFGIKLLCSYVEK